MALSKEQKIAVVNEVSELLNTSKMTVVAEYSGISVKSMQAMRKQSVESNTIVRVVKNRLMIQALATIDNLKGVETDNLKGQLLYAFNSNDEVAPAQSLSKFAKSETNLHFVGAITADGQFISAEDVMALADLPSKDQLRAQLVGTISAPLSGFVNVLSGNIRGVMNVLTAHAQIIN